MLVQILEQFQYVKKLVTWKALKPPCAAWFLLCSRIKARIKCSGIGARVHKAKAYFEIIRLSISSQGELNHPTVTQLNVKLHIW